MENYDELVKELRSGCGLPVLQDKMSRAADAIEKLQKRVQEWQEEACKWNNEYYALHDSILRWTSVKEQLPEPKFAREWYLVHLESGCVKTLAFEKSGTPNNLFKDGWHETASRITHWMPLPTPPKEDEA